MTEAFVTVDSFDAFADASTAKALLESAGIKVLLADVETTSLNFLWAGWTGGIKVNVPASQAEAAMQLVRQLREANQKLSASGDDAALKSQCLECGAELVGDGDHCVKCGWSFEGEDYTDYANGPVPDSLLKAAYSPIDSKEFALPAEAVPKYVAWCAMQGIQVHSWEVWLRGPLRHRVVEVIESGDGRALLLAVPKAVADHGLAALFCVKTARRELENESDA